MITGAVIAMGVSSVRGLATEVVVILIVLALAFVAGGLALRRYNRPKDDI